MVHWSWTVPFTLTFTFPRYLQIFKSGLLGEWLVKWRFWNWNRETWKYKWLEEIQGSIRFFLQERKAVLFYFPTTKSLQYPANDIYTILNLFIRRVSWTGAYSHRHQVEVRVNTLGWSGLPTSGTWWVANVQSKYLWALGAYLYVGLGFRTLPYNNVRKPVGTRKYLQLLPSLQHLI